MEFDLTSPRTYLTSLALLRQTLEVSGRPQRLLELVVQLPFSCGSVTVYLRMSNLYIIAFRGADGVYALSDPSVDGEDLVKKSGLVPNGVTVETIKLQGDHGSLGTDRRSFGTKELAHCAALARYRRGQHDAEVAGAISLLVCMISEAARFLEIQNTFAGVGPREGSMIAGLNDNLGLWAGPVQATEVVYVWSKATRARTLSARLNKGPSELHNLIVKLRAALPNQTWNWSDFVKWAYGSADQDAVTKLWDQAPAAAALKQALVGTGPQPRLNREEASDLLGLCESSLVVRAAMGMLLEMR